MVATIADAGRRGGSPPRGTGRGRHPPHRLGPALPGRAIPPAPRARRDDWTPPPTGPAGRARPLHGPLRAGDRHGRARRSAKPQSFEVDVLGHATLAAADRDAVLAFQSRVARLQRAVLGAERLVDELESAARPGAQGDRRDAGARSGARPPRARARARARSSLDRDLGRPLPAPPPGEHAAVDLGARPERWSTAAGTRPSPPTATQVDAYRIAGEAFATAARRARQAPRRRSRGARTRARARRRALDARAGCRPGRSKP